MQTILFSAGRLAASFAPRWYLPGLYLPVTSSTSRGDWTRGWAVAEIRQKILRGTSLPHVAWTTSVWRPHARRRGTCPVSPSLVHRQQEPWASGQSQHPHGLRAQGVLVGGGRTDTISVCPQGRVEEPAGSGLQDLALPHGHINHEGRQQARTGVRSTQAGAPGAEPWPALAPLGPPHPRQEVRSLCLCIPQTGSE